MSSDVLRLSPRITILPVIHGSGDFALEVRRYLLEQPCDCVAVPLPPSFQESVETALLSLPVPTLVLQPRAAEGWRESDGEDSAAELPTSYVPIDPCQGVIVALRWAQEEHVERAFIDQETATFVPYSQVLPDPYALKQVPLDRFAAAVLPAIERPTDPQRISRIATMAARLRDLEQRRQAIVCVCSILDWPWLREAYFQQPEPGEDDLVETPEIYQAETKNLLFMLGELPFITGLYERARAELEDDRNLQVDGVKELLLAARDGYRKELKKRARKITPTLLRQCLQYVRNLALIDRRMTPDMYALVVAAKQMAGDQFARHVAETIREYPYAQSLAWPVIRLGVDRGRLPSGDILPLVSRLPIRPVNWRNCSLQTAPPPESQEKWGMRWNPFNSQCSWPPEDEQIERFRTSAFDRAKAVVGMDMARTEKFSTSLKDGLDIRETLRNWHTGDLYVKEYPATRGKLDCVVMLFDSPADPRTYTWRTTWYAEHENESTLAFFATDFHKQFVGPGIGLSTYGGAMFIYPPRPIRDIWTDKRLDFTDTLEERLLGAACLHSNHHLVALVSSLPPGAGWRRLAARFKRKLVHLPLGNFSASLVDQLRMFHVLNGRKVRSFAADFIRRA